MTIPKTISEDDNVLTVSDVAEALNVHRSTVHYWIKNGMVKSKRVGVFHTIKRSELKRLRKMYGEDTK